MESKKFSNGKTFDDHISAVITVKAVLSGMLGEWGVPVSEKYRLTKGGSLGAGLAHGKECGAWGLGGCLDAGGGLGQQVGVQGAESRGALTSGGSPQAATYPSCS